MVSVYVHQTHGQVAGMLFRIPVHELLVEGDEQVRLRPDRRVTADIVLLFQKPGADQVEYSDPQRRRLRARRPRSLAPRALISGGLALAESLLG
jgi:hypothetical protein